MKTKGPVTQILDGLDVSVFTFVFERNGTRVYTGKLSGGSEKPTRWAVPTGKTQERESGRMAAKRVLKNISGMDSTGNRRVSASDQMRSRNLSLDGETARSELRRTADFACQATPATFSESRIGDTGDWSELGWRLLADFSFNYL